jgi:hypothetical protein
LILSIELNDWNVDGLKSDKRNWGSGAAVVVVAVDDDDGWGVGFTGGKGGAAGVGFDNCFSSLSK